MTAEILKSLFRQFASRPISGLANLLGLATGIAACTLIFLYALGEMNFNDWIVDQDDLYMVEGQFLQSSSGGYMSSTMAPLQPAIERDMPEVEASTRWRSQLWPVKRNDAVNYESVDFVDNDFLQIFPLEFLQGSRDTALPNLNSTAISQSMALKYFGTESPLGQTLIINGDLSYTVTGVFTDLPANSDFELDFVASYRNDLEPNFESWNNVNLLTFLRLSPEGNVADVTEKLATLVDQNRPFMGDSPGDMREIFRLFPQPIGDFHLGSTGRGAGNSIGNYALIYGLLTLAIVILLVSAFNYVSMAMARALEREKEICLRKILGAGYNQVARHMLGESIGQTVLAAIIGLLIVLMLLPFFNNLVDREFAAADIFSAQFLAPFFVGSFLLGTLAGLYPALFIAGFKPVRFLTGGRAGRTGISKLRSALVLIQFTVAIALTIGAGIIWQQMSYISDLDIGFDKEDLVVLRAVRSEESSRLTEVLKSELDLIPGVVSVARSSVVPMDSNISVEGFYSKFVSRDEGPGLRAIARDFDFLDTFRASLIAGRDLSEDFAEDQFLLDAYKSASSVPANRNVIIDEVGARRLGFADYQSAVGEQFQMALEDGGSQTLTIIGIVDEMRFRSLTVNENPPLYFYDPNVMYSTSVRLDPATMDTTIAAINRVWSKVFPDTPLRMDFMNEHVDRFYRTERMQIDLFMLFSLLAILLSFIGIIGMVQNSIVYRLREISIRKVMGASVANILRLFTMQYVKPVLIANIPAWVIAAYFANDWLEKYSARIEMGPMLFVEVGAGLVLVTITLVSILVIRSALTPPAHVLRYE